MKLIARYIDVMKAHEKAIGDLYRLFAKKIPKEEKFWNKIAREEDSHADILQLLDDQVESRETVFIPRDFKLVDILESLDFIKVIIEATAGQNKVTMKEALEAALQIEKSMLEKEFFSFFDSDSKEFQKDIEDLRIYTEQHIERLSEKLRSCSKWSITKG